MISRSPLLVWLVFHPRSEAARTLARDIHHHLNGDVAVPGLRVPTAFCPVATGDLPPRNLRLDFAERNFVILLADDLLAADEEWSRFVADVWEQNQNATTRFVPIQLSLNAWPLDQRLEETNFTRAYRQAPGAERDAFIIRRVVVELCRYLAGRNKKGEDSAAPVRLFLSHAKADMQLEPKVAQRLIEALQADQPIKAWVDSGDIPAGSKFAEEIARGVGDSSLLVVLTDNYATREFCREEILLAKEHQRPMVIVDALTRCEVRSFPYSGNIARLRWDGNPQAGIDLLLKETLRCLHAQAQLEQCRQATDVVFTRPPELLTLLGIKEGNTVLYPDPPLSAAVTRRLSKTNITVVTPLQRSALRQPLKGKLVALSMSESTDTRQFPDAVHLASNMLELSRYLLINGASLAYGGHLGAEGYTQRLFELVRAHNQLDGVPRFGRVVNFLGWPLPRPTDAARAELKLVTKTIELPRPLDIDETLHPSCVERPAFFSGDASAEQRFAWARGMTEMRKLQADSARSNVIARVVLGGAFGPTEKLGADGQVSLKWYFGRIPGVLEEVLYSVESGQPVFLIGAYGGAARLVIDVLQGRDRPEATWAFQKEAPFASEIRSIYERRGLPWIDYPEIVSRIRGKGVVGINPFLSQEEHEMLFETVDPVQIVELVMLGLGRM